MTEPTFTAYAGDLITAINRVKHAMADDDARPILASFVIETLESGKLRLLAADNYRIASQVVESADVTGEWPRTVVSRDGVPTLLAFLSSVKADDVTVSRTDTTLTVTGSDERSVDVRLVDGMYPNTAFITDAEPGPVLATFNPKFLADAGEAAGRSPIVHVKGTDPLSAVLFTDNDGYREWVMPVKVAS